MEDLRKRGMMSMKNILNWGRKDALIYWLWGKYKLGVYIILTPNHITIALEGMKSWIGLKQGTQM